MRNKLIKLYIILILLTANKKLHIISSAYPLRYYLETDTPHLYLLYETSGKYAGYIVGKSNCKLCITPNAYYICFVEARPGSHHVSEDLYNILILDALLNGSPGVESGHILVSPTITKKVTAKFPSIKKERLNKNLGKKLFNFTFSIFGNKEILLLTGITSRLLPMKISKTHISFYNPGPIFPEYIKEGETINFIKRSKAGKGSFILIGPGYTEYTNYYIL